jgi:hypothetical protein
MNNAFNKEELVPMRGKNYPVVGGRLRLAHEAGNPIITTSIVKYEHLELAVVVATVCVADCTATGHGMASKNSDKKLIDSLLELAETRAIARALRFCGYGVEYTGHEEMQKDSISDGAKVSNRQDNPEPKKANKDMIKIKEDELRNAKDAASLLDVAMSIGDMGEMPAEDHKRLTDLYKKLKGDFEKESK